MKPVLEHLPLGAGESFVVKDFDYDHYPTPWHFHPEYELVLVTESTGKRFIGDHVADFGPGNLVLIGAGLPHLYRNDPAYYTYPYTDPAPYTLESGLRARSIVVHFLDTAFGAGFFQLPESGPIRSLLARSARGLEITGETNVKAGEMMHALVRLTGFRRLLCLLDLLDVLATADGSECFAISGHTIIGQNERESGRLNEVFEFVMNNFHREIRMAEVAELVHMAENSFSRYFSQRTRKPFSQFVMGFRLNHAARLLVEGQVSISDICFSCGFSSISNFNKQFRKVYKMNPLGYRKLYRQKLLL